MTRSMSWLDAPNTQIHDRSLSWLDTPNTQIHDRSLSWLDTPNTQIHDPLTVLAWYRDINMSGQFWVEVNLTY